MQARTPTLAHTNTEADMKERQETKTLFDAGWGGGLLYLHETERKTVSHVTFAIISLERNSRGKDSTALWPSRRLGHTHTDADRHAKHNYRITDTCKCHVTV